MIDIAENELVKVARENGDLYIKTAEVRNEKNLSVMKEQNKEASSSFKSFATSLDTLSKNVFEANSREKSKLAQKQLKSVEEAINKNKEMTDAEKTILRENQEGINAVNQSLINNEHSFSKALGSVLKEKAPDIAGILGSIGLDNPAFLFLGSMMSSMMKKRKEARIVSDEILKDQHRDKELNDQARQVEKIDAEKKLQDEKPEKPELKEKEDPMLGPMQDIGPVNDQQLVELENQTALLDYISGLIDTIIKDSENSKFQEIENNRESVRRQEAMIDAVNGINGEVPQEENSKESDGGGFLSNLIGGKGGVFKGIMKVISVIGAFIAPLGTALAGMATMIAPIVGGVVAAYAVYEGIKGAFTGWENAAEKLGKEQASTTDKIASAFGGFLGGITGLGDSLLGLFGIETDMGGWVDQKITEITAAGFDWIKGLGMDITGLFTKVGDFITLKKEELWTWIDNALGGAMTRVKDFFTGIFNFAFPEGFSITDILLVPLRIAKGWVETLFKFDLPEIPSMGQLAEEGINKMTTIVTDIFDSIVNAFKSFSVRALLDMIPGVPDIIKNRFKKKEIIEEKQKPTIDIETTVKERGKWWIPSYFMKDKEKKEEEKLVTLNDERFKTDDLPLAEKQPRMLAMEKQAQYIKQEAIEKEKASSVSSASIVNAPSSTRVNNVSNNTSVHHTNISPQEMDLSLRNTASDY